MFRRRAWGRSHLFASCQIASRVWDGSSHVGMSCSLARMYMAGLKIEKYIATNKGQNEMGCEHAEGREGKYCLYIKRKIQEW